MPVTHGGGVKKEWKSWEDQVALLKGRHLALDEGEALGLLRTASYYRLSGYARYFQQGAELGGNDFVAGSTLADIKMIHELDGRLRTMLASRLGRVEVMLRSQYAYAVGATKGPYGDYLDDAYFGGGDAGADVVDACLRDLDRSKEPFVRHFRREGTMIGTGTCPSGPQPKSFPSRTSATGARTMRDCGITPSSMPGPPRTMCARRPSAGSGISMDVP